MSKKPAEPHLKKKISFRDRLRWPPTKPASDTETIQEKVIPGPKFAYKPRHAAADFSRLTIAQQPPRRRAEDQAKSRRAQGSSAPGSADDVGIAAKPERLAPQPWTPTENEAITPIYGHSRPRKHMGQPINALASVPQLPEQSMKPAAPVGSSRQPQKPGLDLWEASHTALYPAPAVASGTPGTAEDDKLTSLNDFELFIARAEAQDRAAYRDKRAGGRSPSQRPGVAVFPVVVKPSPHRQYVSVAANPAPSAERAVSSPSTASTAMARGDLSGGEGERNRRSNRHLTSGQAALAGEECQLAQGQGQGRPHRRENGKRASGAPVCGSTNVTEGVPERKTAPRPPPVVVYGVDETFQAPDPRSSQRPRALRKQASIAQKIAEYIRPPKVATATPSPRENQVVAARPYRSVRRPSSIG